MTDLIADLTKEQWTDVATLSMLALMFWTMLYYELKRTWKWERLGVALTIVTACLAVGYSFGALDLVLVADLWISPIRWAIRMAILGSGILTIYVLRFDEPPEY